MNSTSTLPSDLKYVPDRQKVVGISGHQPVIWGTMFLMVACLLIFNGGGPRVAIGCMIAGSAAALGLCLAGYEVWRRRSRTVLVKDGLRIAVFRKGRLDMVLVPEEIAEAKPGFVIMLKIGVPLGIAAAIFSAIAITGLLRDESGTVDYLIILSLGLACAASLASAARVRFTCRHLRIPVKGSRWLAEETVLIHPSRMKDLFPASREPGPGPQ